MRYFSPTSVVFGYVGEGDAAGGVDWDGFRGRAEPREVITVMPPKAVGPASTRLEV